MCAKNSWNTFKFVEVIHGKLYVLSSGHGLRVQRISTQLLGNPQLQDEISHEGDVGRSIKLANFCGRGLVSRENLPENVSFTRAVP